MTKLAIRDGSAYSIYADSQGKQIREDSRHVIDSVGMFDTSQDRVEHNKRLHVKKRTDNKHTTVSQDFYTRRAREYDLIRSHMNKRNCKKQLAVYVKFSDGNKYLVAFVDFFRKGKKLYGGSISPVFWYDISTSYKRTLRGMIDVTDTLPESVMRNMLDIHEKDVHVYAQSLDSIHPTKLPTTRYEKINPPRYRATGQIVYGKPLDEFAAHV